MQRPPNQNPKRLAPSLKRAALQIARFRAILDWALALPQWEAPIDLSLKRLDIKAGRQGVSQATALRNLPIEKKYRIMRTILSGELPTPCFSETNRLARLTGITVHDRSPTFDRLPSAKWDELRKKITLRLATRYQQYKNAQQELFAHFYQLDNFRGVDANVFGASGDINILCVPGERDVRVNLPEVQSPTEDWKPKCQAWMAAQRAE